MYTNDSAVMLCSHSALLTSLCVIQEQSSEGPPPPLSLSQEAKEVTLDNPSATDELDTPTSIASVMTSINESSTETDTPQQTDTEVHDFSFCRFLTTS